MAYDPFEGFRKAAGTYAGPKPNIPMPNRLFDRSNAEPWVLGTEMGPPKELANTVGLPTDADKARWGQAQMQFASQYTPAKPVEGPIVSNPVDDLHAAGSDLVAQFNWKNPIPGMERDYERGGLGAVLGNRLRAGIKGVKSMADPKTMQGAREFLQNVANPEGQTVAPLKPRPAPTPLEAGDMPVTPKFTSLGNGYGVAGSNTSERAGYTNKTYYDPAGNVVGSGLSSATGRGGFVGASTDAQAAKALQDRAEQNAAAQFNIDSMNRVANAERDLRAARLGVSRGVLDRMEGRNDTAAAAADSAAQGAIPDRWNNPLSVPGDSFQDTRGRQAEYDRAVKQALTGNTLGQKGAAATLTALNDLREKNLAAQVAQNKTQTGVDPIDMNRFLLDQQKFNYQQKNDANRYLLDEQKFNYQQGLDKQRLVVDKSEAEGKQAERQLARQKYMDESRKTFVSEFSFSDPKAPREQIAGAVFDISQATGVPTDAVSQIYEQTVKELGIDYGKGGPKDSMKLNELVAARVTQKYRGQ